jgi:hypothetical protein
MMQRAWTLVSGFAMLTTLGIIACSSADTPEGDDGGTGGSSGSGGSATGGSAPTGGTSTGGSSTGGTSTGGTSTGGSAPTGGTGGTGDLPNPDQECRGIKSNQACMIEGKSCPNMACGLADSGRRDCNCATNWTCSACNYDNSPFKDRPADVPACPPEAGDEVPCTEMNAVCQPAGTEVCACYQDAMDGLIWDCDSPPSSWM